ncbi:hypothetical protein ID866_6264 [Astraeus odoratus]|nr:hypothetical protein ID866_6264 [Astraeus odoratus]
MTIGVGPQKKKTLYL